MMSTLLSLLLPGLVELAYTLGLVALLMFA